jgi:WD40 repeat protein
MDVEADTQRFFNKHDEDIVCLAIHPSKKFIATGNMAEKGRKFTDIYVWDVETLEIKARLNTYHEKSVR